MSVCMWKGKLSSGGILCGKPLEHAQITTDAHIVTCKDCKIELASKINARRHIHLNVNFLDGAFLTTNNEGNPILNFKEMESGKPLCSLSKNYATTNDPKEITCKHCINGVWGSKDAKIFILAGFMTEGGLSLIQVRSKLRSMSNLKLKEMLNTLLYGNKV